jgi:hypothetical protein
VTGMAEVALPITGKVAEILDRYTLAINRGVDDGVEIGMIFAVIGAGGEIIDPDTDKPLGPRPVEKLRVKVTDVYEKFSVAQTYRLVTPPRSLSDLMGGPRAGEFLSSIATTWSAIPPGPERERFAGAPAQRDPEPTNPVIHVGVGDAVRQVFHQAITR